MGTGSDILIRNEVPVPIFVWPIRGTNPNSYYEIVLFFTAFYEGFDSILDVQGAYSILIQEFIGLSRP
jgi:hypothetical protein